MPLQEQFLYKIVGQGTTEVNLQYNDANNLITALIMRGNMNRRALCAVAAPGFAKAAGRQHQPEIRLELASDGFHMVPSDTGGVKPPPDFISKLEVLVEDP